METIEFFKQLKALEEKISNNYKMIAYFKELASGRKVQTMKDMPKGSNPKSDTATRMLMNAFELEEETKKLENKYLEMQALALEIIKEIENYDCQCVLLKHYFERKSIQKIANELSYTKRWVYILHGRAKKIFEKKLSKRVHISSH